MRLNSFPMPPSSNNMYATLRSRRRIKSVETKIWERDVDRWAMQYASSIIQIRAQLQQAVEAGHVIQVDAKFWFERSAILSKKGKPIRIDTSNRLKGLHDGLARILGIDDSYFWHGSFQKIPTDGATHEWVDCEFSTRTVL